MKLRRASGLVWTIGICAAAVGFSEEPGEFTTVLGDATVLSVARLRVDAAGNTVIAGTQRTSEGSSAFVSKIDRDGKVLFTTSIGGQGYSAGLDVAWTPRGEIVLTGETTDDGIASSDGFQQKKGFEGVTGFVALLRGTDGVVLRSTYFGGKGASSVEGVAVDSQGAVYLTGWTTSADFPVTENAFRPFKPLSPFPTPFPPVSVVFITKFRPMLNGLEYSSYLGGTFVCASSSSCLFQRAFNSGVAVAVDTSGNAHVAGNTNTGDFPPARSFQSPGYGPFVFKVNAAGSMVEYLDLLGGGSFGSLPRLTSADSVVGLAVDSSGAAYITGRTRSGNFPVTSDAYQQTFAGPAAVSGPAPPADGFVAKLNPQGTALEYSTYLGGTGEDLPRGISVDANGVAWITGRTQSTQFPDGERLFPRSTTFIAGIAHDGGGLVYAGRFPAGATGAAIHVSPDGFLFTAGTSVISALDIVTKPPLHFFGLANAAAGEVGSAVAPGQVVSVFGRGLGPDTPVIGVAEDDRFSPVLASVRLWFDDLPAPLLYVSKQQVNAVVPFGIQGTRTKMRLTFGGQSSSVFELPVNESAVQVFRGEGDAAAAINEDGTLNTRENPARPGSALSVWVTGLGLYAGAVDGEVYRGEAISTFGNRVTVNGLPALFAGPAPGLVAGVSQVNFRTPGVPVDGVVAVGILVSIDGMTAGRVTVFVRR